MASPLRFGIPFLLVVSGTVHSPPGLPALRAIFSRPGVYDQYRMATVVDTACVLDVVWQIAGIPNYLWLNIFQRLA